ncbi:MAG: hypothetical protein WDN28_33135 [Chthoniobacter sp.]
MFRGKQAIGGIAQGVPRLRRRGVALVVTQFAGQEGAGIDEQPAHASP